MPKFASIDPKITFYLFLIIGLVSIPPFWGQEDAASNRGIKGIDHQFELKHDNDFLMFTDRYYSSGSFITYRWLSENKKDSLNNRQHTLFISHEIYTPSDLLETNTRFYERPYAGFLGFHYQYSIAKTTRLFRFEYGMGFTGKMSGASGLQSLFHDTAAEDSRIATWLGQINNGITNNLYFTYLKEWKLQNNPLSFHISAGPTIALGTKDIFLQNDFGVYIGIRNPMNSSLAYDQLSVISNELFVSLILTYRYVIHDTLLEGNLIGDSSLVLREPYQNLYLFKLGLNYRLRRNDFKLIYNYETAETRKAEPHAYFTISIARSF
jgi:hypothetical protein